LEIPKKLLNTILLCLLFASGYAQMDKQYKYIHFRHSNGAFFGSEINIRVFPNHKKENYFSVEVEKSEYTNIYKIKEKKFSEIWTAISEIKPSDLMKENRFCLDGGTTSIQFSKGFHSIKVDYSLYCLNSNDDKTAWKDYLNAVKLILEVAKLNYSDLK